MVKSLLSSIREYSKRYIRKRSFLRIVKQSGLFDQSFYFNSLSNYTGPKSENSLILHYLEFGEKMGLSPSASFDASWYMQHYPEVAQNTDNALLHYIQFGSSEGRFPTESHVLAYAGSLRSRVERELAEYVWCGYPKESIKELLTIFNDNKIDSYTRFLAGWHIARWFYFLEEYEFALNIAQVAIALDSNLFRNKAAVLMLSFCLIKVKRETEANSCLSQYLKQFPHDASVLLALANLVEDTGEKLSLINQIYQTSGLATIRTISTNGPLSFNQLTTSAVNTQNDHRKVSVIIPAFNASPRIEIAINSLLNQSWSNLEVIVVDDCSIDNTVDIVKSMAARDERITLIEQKTNAGAYCARNAGLRIATGDFITTHDSDDWSHPQKIELQLKYLDNNEEVVGVCTHWVRANEKLEFQHNWRLNTSLIHWSHSSFLFRREVVKELGEWDNVIVGGDTEFIWRVKARFGKDAVANIHSEFPLAFALDEENSLTRNNTTHVRTMHHGLRHIYRSACQEWHKRATNLRLSNSENERAFVAPRPLKVRNDNKISCDLLLIGDFRVNSLTNSQIEVLKLIGNVNLNAVLYHVPRFGLPLAPISDIFFEVLLNSNVEVCVFGMEVRARHAVLLHSQLLHLSPDDRAEISTDAVVICKNNEESELHVSETRPIIVINASKPLLSLSEQEIRQYISQLNKDDD